MAGIPGRVIFFFGFWLWLTGFGFGNRTLLRPMSGIQDWKGIFVDSKLKEIHCYCSVMNVVESTLRCNSLSARGVSPTISTLDSQLSTPFTFRSTRTHAQECTEYSVL